MAKANLPPEKPKKPKDPARRTRAKASRPDTAATPDALAELLNPGIGRGTSGMGSGTGGIQPPPDNSFDRRKDFSAAHQARKSKGFGEAPQAEFTGAPVTGLDPALANELGLGDGQDASDAGREQSIKDALVVRAGGDPKYRLPRADLPTGPGGLSSMGVAATADALEKLLREGREEFRAEAETGKVWTPHRPPRPEKSEGGQKFVIKSEFEPKGDQPQAIKDLVEGVKRHDRTQVLLGVTGSGKTFTMAKVIEATQRPALILAPNKTLAAQLYGEFRNVLPRQRGGVFRLLLRLLPAGSLRPAHRHLYREGFLDQRADRPHAPLGDARACLERDDVIIVASVSCIYGIGSVETYSAMTFSLKQGSERIEQRQLHRRPGGAAIQAHPGDFFRGTFRVRGDVIEIFPAHYEDRAWRVNAVRRRGSRRSPSSIRSPGRRPTNWNSSRSMPIRTTSRRARR